MKLRIRGNSIRLRLTRSEVARLVNEGVVSEQVRFDADAVLQYSIASIGNGEGEAISAALDGPHIRVQAHKAVVERWAQSDEVGFESAPAAALKIIVEKDWTCLTPRTGDDDDTFPNPNQTC